MGPKWLHSKLNNSLMNLICNLICKKQKMVLIPQTTLLSQSPQGKFLHRNGPSVPYKNSSSHLCSIVTVLMLSYLSVFPCPDPQYRGVVLCALCQSCASILQHSGIAHLKHIHNSTGFRDSCHVLNAQDMWVREGWGGVEWEWGVLLA